MSAPILVTGATGLIGNALAMDLVARGHDVRALVRDPERARAVLPERVTLVRGDVTSPDSLPAAVRDVEWLFHAAGMNVTLRQYPGDSTLAPQMLSDMNRWLMEIVTGAPAVS